MKNKSTYDLGFKKLEKLLSLGTKGTVPDDSHCGSDAMVSALHETLTTPLGQGSDLIKPLITMLESKGGTEDLKACLMEILLNSHTGIDVLRTLKAFGKELSNTTTGKSEETLGMTLYHAAIASALVFHKEKITSSDSLKLETVFTLLASKEWTPPEIKQLYEKANDVCGRKEP